MVEGSVEALSSAQGWKKRAARGLTDELVLTVYFMGNIFIFISYFLQQIITLMDKLLLNENMDLKLTPYKVLATSSKYGFVQYIDSISIAEVRFQWMIWIFRKFFSILNINKFITLLYWDIHTYSTRGF